ncbi:vWA domain-containing protein [Nannocystis sp.]|uniref:vWA domain-containing protein n=1 Tax=Nannocystis sp. TaxID=1962667 RepID=UPI0025F1BA87|nr:vWA domain-containing protein [Nannocystis sp.]
MLKAILRPLNFWSRRARLAVAMTAAVSLAGCALTVTRLNSAQKKPNNVWVFFTVEKGDEPVAGLQAEDFEIYEDDELVSVYESKQVIQNPEVAAVMYTMLLLDVSGSVTESGSTDSLVDAAELFTDRVGKTQKVGVYAFDGEKEIKSVVPFTESEGAAVGGLEGLRSYKAKDPSTNLHGAVIEGLKELKKGLDKEKKPLKFGTLVVFSDGTDRAARFSRDEMKTEIAKEQYSDYEMYAIGVGAEIKKAGLGGCRQGRHRAGDRAGRGQDGLRAGRRAHREAHQALLPAQLLHAGAQGQARGPHHRQQQERPEGQGLARVGVQRGRLRAAAGLRPEHAAVVPAEDQRAAGRGRRRGRRWEGRREREGEGQRERRGEVRAGRASWRSSWVRRASGPPGWRVSAGSGGDAGGRAGEACTGFRAGAEWSILRARTDATRALCHVASHARRAPFLARRVRLQQGRAEEARSQDRRCGDGGR